VLLDSVTFTWRYNECSKTCRSVSARSLPPPCLKRTSMLVPRRDRREDDGSDGKKSKFTSLSGDSTELMRIYPLPLTSKLPHLLAPIHLSNIHLC
jgi:hypothetical protein